MSNLAKIQPQEVSTQTAPAPYGGSEILSSDILVPRLLLMQGLSEFVKERKAQPGDIMRSTTVEKVGDPTQPLEFIPLKVVNAWAESEVVGGKAEFKKSIPRTPDNEHYPWDFFRNPQGQEFDKPGQLGATAWKRMKSINCFGILPGDIDAFEAEMKKAAESGEMPDLTKTILPVMISFRSTSFKAGQAISTFFAQVEEMKRSVPTIKHYAYTLPLSCADDKNDKGSYYIFKVGAPKKLDAKYLAVAERWWKLLTQLQDVKVDSDKE